MMNAKCGQCGTEIRLDESKLGERGARVRCPSCSSTVVIERAPKGPELLDIDFGSGLAPQVADPAAFDAAAINAPALDRSPKVHAPGGKATPAAPAPAPPGWPPPPASAGEPELLGDEDLELADADEVTDAALSGPAAAKGAPALAPAAPGRVPPTPAPASTLSKLVAATVSPSRPAAGPTAPGPIPDFDVKTRVAPAPNLARPAVSDRPPSALEATATGIPDLHGPDDSLMMGGALSADGSLVPAQQPRSAAPSFETAGPALAVTRPVALDYSNVGSVTTKASWVSDTGRAQTPDRPRASAPRIVAAVAGAIAAVALLFFGMIVFLSGGRVDERVLRLDHEALTTLWTSRPVVALDGVRVTGMRSFFYPIRTGEQALVFSGEVKNLGAEPRQHLQITAEVRDQGGRLLASAHAPVGAALAPPDLWASDDPVALERAYRADPSASDTVPPSGTAPFEVVITHAPPQAEHQRHLVVLGYADPPKIEAPSPPEPEPAPPKTKAKARAKAKPAKP
jgi:predicted Zn finger-like uncharacterized protein